MKTTLSILAAIALWWTLGACEHKDLCYYHPHDVEVDVSFRWDLVPNPAEAMRVFFYPVDGGPPHVFDVPGKDPSSIKVPPGEYIVVTYNTDTDNMHEQNGENLDKLELVSSPHAPVQPDDANDPKRKFFHEPSPIYRTRIDRVVVTPPLNGNRPKLELTPEQVVWNYTFEIRGVKNLQYARQIQGSLSNMSTSYLVGSGTPGITPGEIVFDGKVEGNLIVGGFQSFGPLAGFDPKLFTLYIRTNDKNLFTTFDVTSQVVPPANGSGNRTIHIVIETDFELPMPIGNGEGFRPDVEDWEPAVHRLLEI